MRDIVVLGSGGHGCFKTALLCVWVWRWWYGRDCFKVAQGGAQACAIEMGRKKGKRSEEKAGKKKNQKMMMAMMVLN